MAMLSTELQKPADFHWLSVTGLEQAYISRVHYTDNQVNVAYIDPPSYFNFLTSITSSPQREAPKKLKAFLFWTSHSMIVQHFAAFIRFSGDDCRAMTFPRLKLHGNQQEIGVSEGNEKEQGIKIPGIARIHL